MDTETANRIFPELGARLHPTYRAGRLKARRCDVPDARIHDQSENGRTFRRGYEHGLLEIENMLLELDEERAYKEFRRRMLTPDPTPPTPAPAGDSTPNSA